MSIRFKFRSSVNFDIVEIDGGKPYISVAELRSKILCQKKLNGISHKDFDLVFFDAITDQEYNDDKFKIPSGSSVIVKRVPAEPAPSPMLRHSKPEASELSEDIRKVVNIDADCKRQEEVVSEKKLEQDFGEHGMLEKVASEKGIDLQKVGLPPELRCPLCSTYFKDAVMIPCCQHSFCDKCIREVLLLTARCPKCSSTKHRVEHLLPNLSLRCAIKHFLESQILATAPENELQKYVPDGESGIHGKEVSCTAPVTKRKLDLVNPTSAMEKRSNQNMAESAYESLKRKDSLLEGSGYHNSNTMGLLNATSLLKVNNGTGNRDGLDDSAPFADCEGENQPLNMPKFCVPDEVESMSRKNELWVNSGGGARQFVVGNKNKKADRTCYNCGTPGHFMRECPFGSAQHPMFQRGDPMFQGGMAGYTTPYWNGFPPVNSYMNAYGNPGMVPFNATMVPITPYGVPHYLPSTYGNLPVHGGIMTMGGLTPAVGTRTEAPSMHSENLEPQNGEQLTDGKRRLYSYEDDGSYERHHYHEQERSAEYKSGRDRGKSLNYSEENHGRKLLREHRHDKHLDQNSHSFHQTQEKNSRSTNDVRDRRSYHTDRTISGVEDGHSGGDGYDEVRHKQHCQSSRRHHSSREQSGSDSSWARHQNRKRRDVESVLESDVGAFHQKNNRDRKNPRADEDHIEGYHHSKRKRMH